MSRNRDKGFMNKSLLDIAGELVRPLHLIPGKLKPGNSKIGEIFGILAPFMRQLKVDSGKMQRK